MAGSEPFSPSHNRGTQFHSLHPLHLLIIREQDACTVSPVGRTSGWSILSGWRVGGGGWKNDFFTVVFILNGNDNDTDNGNGNGNCNGNAKAMARAMTMTVTMVMIMVMVVVVVMVMAMAMTMTMTMTMTMAMVMIILEIRDGVTTFQTPYPPGIHRHNLSRYMEMTR